MSAALQREQQRQHQQRLERQRKQAEAAEAAKAKSSSKHRIYGVDAGFVAALSELNDRVAVRWDSRLDFLEELGKAEARDQARSQHQTPWAPK